MSGNGAEMPCFSAPGRLLPPDAPALPLAPQEPAYVPSILPGLSAEEDAAIKARLFPPPVDTLGQGAPPSLKPVGL